MVATKNHVFILLTVAVTGSLLYFYFDPSLNKFFPPCPFFTLTGLYCPGCGSQRALHDILHGHISAAADHNILFVLFLPLILFSAGVTMNNIFNKKKITQRIFNSTAFTLAVLISVILFWIFRNIPVEPFPYLAP